MKTLTQIAHELGYKGVDSLYWKMKTRGIEVASLKRYVGGPGNKYRLYDEETEQYIKATCGSCHHLQPKPVRDIAQPVSMKDSDSKPIQATAKKAEKKAATKKISKSKVSAPKTVKADKVQAAPSVTPSASAADVELNRRLQQLQVLGEVLVSQINQLTTEVSGQKQISAPKATYLAS